MAEDTLIDPSKVVLADGREIVGVNLMDLLERLHQSDQVYVFDKIEFCSYTNVITVRSFTIDDEECKPRKYQVVDAT
jgi:hypothetical protein